MSITLKDSTESIKAVLAGSSLAGIFNSSFFDHVPGGTGHANASFGATNGVTAVTVVSAPTSGLYRTIEEMSIYNNDSSSIVPTLYRDVSGASYPLYKNTILPGQTLIYNKNGWNIVGSGPSGLIGRSGLTLSNNTINANYYLDIEAGRANDSTFTDIIVLDSAFTKYINAAWASGSSAGGMDTGSVTAGNWYHVWLMKRPDTGHVDICFSLSRTAPTTGGNIPAAYTKFRHLGAVLVDSSGILGFVQFRNRFYWKGVQTPNPNGVNVGSTPITYTTSAPPETIALLKSYFYTDQTSNNFLFIYPVIGITAATAAIANAANCARYLDGSHLPQVQMADSQICLNTSSQFIACTTNGSSGNAVYITCIGWIDPDY